MWFCTLYSGSSGNSIYVGTKNTNILIDAGLSGKKINSSLKEIGIEPNKIDAILVTHEHIDHSKGVGILSRMFNIPIYANNKTWEAMSNIIGSVKDENVKVINTRQCFDIGDITVKAYKTPHDAAESNGYCFMEGNKKISIATDIGHISDEVYDNIKDSDITLLESNHDVDMLKVGPYPYVLKRRILSDIGHLSNKAAGECITKLISNKLMTVILGHLSHQNNYPELAYQTVKSVLNENDITINKDVNIDIASRESVGKFYQI